MTVVWRITLLFCVLLVINSVVTIPVSEDENDKSSDSNEEESSAEEKGTVSPEVMKKLEEEIIENEEENAEKFGVPMTSRPEDIETYLKKEEKIYGTDLPEVIEKDLEKTKTDDDTRNLAHFIAQFNKVKHIATEDVEVKKTPEELEKLKEENFKLMNELNERLGQPEMSRETYDKEWNEEKKEFGERFPGIAEEASKSLKKTIALHDAKMQRTTPEAPETETVTPTQSTDIVKEELPPGTFALRNAKGNICVLAKFQSSITITYQGKSSELKVEVSIPDTAHTKGKCRGPHGSALMQIAWGKFVFSLSFNKTSEDKWGATLVELAYDTSEPLFDGAAEREKITAKSKKTSFFETPYGNSYFCPAQEVILLYHEDKHVATVRLKEIHLQPYDVEDGKFSAVHRCNQVVLGGPDEEPFVQDETVPLAVGCTLALITLLILVGFSVHRAYNAAKVDYNTVE